MNDSTPRDDAQEASGIRTRSIPVSGVLRPYVGALLAAELSKAGPLPLSVAPHESLMLTVQLGRSSHCIEQKGPQGENTCLTGIRRWTGSFTGAGDCITLFALLTPLGSVHLLESQPLDRVPRIRARVDEILDGKLTRGLESRVATAGTLEEKLLGFAGWLEDRAAASRRLTPAAVRAGRAASRVCMNPGIPMETLADEQHVSRRQLERDFGQWIGTSPRHLAQVARVQAVSRKAQAGGSLAGIAADVGFADQAHMTRVVRQFTGLTPQRLRRPGRTPIAAAFRRLTGGGTVYL